MVPVDLLTDAYLSITQKSLDEILQPITSKKGPVDVVVSYQGFDLKSGLEENYSEKLKDLEKRHYKSVKRYSNQAFRPSKLRSKSSVEAWDEWCTYISTQSSQSTNYCIFCLHTPDFSDVVSAALSEYNNVN